MTLRHRFLHTLKNLPQGERETRAATRLDLLRTGPWPAWLDRDEVEDLAAAQDTARHERGVRRQAWGRLEAAGHGAWATTALAAIGQGLTWRLQPQSPDAMAFLHALCGLLTQVHVACVRDERWDPLDLAFVPSLGDTLLDLWECPVHHNGSMGTLGHFVLQLEKGGMAHAVISETQAHLKGAPFAAEDPLATDLWTVALLDAAHGTTTGWAPARWLEEARTLPLPKLLGTYGRGGAMADIVHAMESMDRVMDELDSIGGTRKIQIFGEDGRSSAYLMEPDGYIPGDDPDHPWANLALRGALVDAFVEGAALMVDKLGTMVVEGHPVRETCVAQIADGTLTWFDAASCRQAFLTDHATGKPLPPEPGRIYRDGPGV